MSYNILEELFRVKTVSKNTINILKKIYKDNKDKNERVLIAAFYILLNKRNIVIEELSNVLGIKKRVIEKIKEAIISLKNFERNFNKYDPFDITVSINKLDAAFVRAYSYKAKGSFKKFSLRTTLKN